MAKPKALKSALNPETAPLQPSATTGRLQPISANYEPNKKTGFLDLPPEVREMIYGDLLRPDLDSFYNASYQGKSQNAIGCTNILMLNRQTYSEAITAVQGMPNTVVLKANRRKLFRHPLAHGKPSFFHSSAHCSTTFVPDGLSELEIISLRNVTIMIFETSKREDIAEIYQAVRKSRTLKHIDLKCQLCYASQDNTGFTYVSARCNVGRWKGTLDPLIHYCLSNRIKLTASENSRFRNQEREPGAPRVFDVLDYRDPLVLYINEHETLQKSNRRIEQAGQRGRDHKQREPLRSFELTPECRRCYSLFATTGRLKQHLTDYPKHAIPFVRRKYNPIHPLAKAGGDRHACLVCGRSYHSEDFLNDHIESVGHQREREQRGVVPRFAKDNVWYRCTSPSSMNELWRGFRGGHWE